MSMNIKYCFTSIYLPSVGKGAYFKSEGFVGLNTAPAVFFVAKLYGYLVSLGLTSFQQYLSYMAHTYSSCSLAFLNCTYRLF